MRDSLRALSPARWDWVSWALALFVVLGIAERVYLMSVYQPAFIGFSDTANYILAAHENLFFDPNRVAGYALFLRFLHLLSPTLLFVVIVQHALGIVAALLVFDSVRRIGFPRPLGLVPAAVLLLSGYLVLLEHAVLTDSPFIFLVSLSLWLTVRVWRGSAWWAMAAGLCLGIATDDRTVGLELLPVALLALALIPRAEIERRRGPSAPRGSRRGVAGVLNDHPILVARTRAACAGIVGCVLATLPFVIAHDVQTGVFNFTTEGNLPLYGRVAPWVDCTKFTPPPGTAALCPHEPPSERLGPNYWDFSPGSPIQPLKQFTDPSAARSAEVTAFAEAAIKAQPWTYLKYVGRSLVRIVDPSFLESPYPRVANAGWGPTEQESAEAIIDPAATVPREQLVDAYYTGSVFHISGATLIVDLASDTAFVGPEMAIALLLAAIAPLVTRGLERRFVVLADAYTLVLLVGPALVNEYDYRYVAPALGTLTAAAAAGAYGLWQRSRGPVRAIVDALAPRTRTLTTLKRGANDAGRGR
jgi:hypothetical protein